MPRCVPAAALGVSARVGVIKPGCSPGGPIRESDAPLQSRSWAMCESQHKTCLIKQARPIKLAPAARGSCLLTFYCCPKEPFPLELNVICHHFINPADETQKRLGNTGTARQSPRALCQGNLDIAASPPPSSGHQGSSELETFKTYLCVSGNRTQR